MKEVIINLVFLYFLAVGISSKSDICIIIPAITENKIPRIISFIKFFKNKNVIKAPKGSDSADIRV